jgi:hypothetical protein
VTVTTTNYTTNSKEIISANEYSSDATIAAVHTAITSLGWTSYDILRNHVPGFGIRGSGATINITSGGTLTLGGISIASAGTGYSQGDILQIIDGTHLNGDSNTAKFEVTAVSGTAISTLALISGGSGYSTANGVSTVSCGSVYSPMHLYVYQAINADGTTYKYLIVRWDTVRQEIFTSCCEGWNTSTKVPTNECYTYMGLFPQGYDLISGNILIAATNRHFVLWTAINPTTTKSDNWGMWTAVFEVEAGNAVNNYPGTAKPPCFFWTNNLMFGTGYGTPIPSRIMVSFPRTIQNQTGSLSHYGTINYAPYTSRMPWPPNYSSPNVGGNHLADLWGFTNSWNTNKSYISPIGIAGVAGTTTSFNDKFSLRNAWGRIYNLSVTNAIATGIADIPSPSPKLDTTGGWADANGSDTTVISLNMVGGSNPTVGTETWALHGATAGSSHTATYTSLGTTYVGKVLQIGGTLWAACSDGVRTLLMSDGQNAATTLRFSSSLITDIMFDGKRTVWAATSTGATAIDIVDYSTVNVALTAGGAYIGMDERYVYVTGRTATVTPATYMINRSTLALDYTSGWGTLTLASGWVNPEPDYAGYIFVVNASGGTGLSVFRVAKIKFDSTAINYVSPLGTTATNYSTYSPCLYIDRTKRVLWTWFSYASQRCIGYNMDDTMTNVYTGSTIAATGTTNSQMLPQATVDYRGAAFIYAYQGGLFTGPARIGQTTAAYQGQTFPRVFIANTAASTTWTRLGVTNSSYNITTRAWASAGYMKSNSINLFGSITVSASDNRIYWFTNGYGGTGKINLSKQRYSTASLLLKG